MSRTRIALWGVAITVALVAFGLFTGRLHADAASGCTGAGSNVNAPRQVAPYECQGTKVIDGTTITALLSVTDTTATVHYTLGAPRAVDTPIRVRSHVGISSTPAQPTEASGVIPAGQTTGVLSVPLSCGQIDVKAVFTGNGDKRGRVVAPYVTNDHDCAVAPPTTAPSTTAPGGSTTPTTSSPSTPTSASPHAEVVRTVPAGSQLAATGLDLGWALAIIAVVLALAVIAIVASRQGVQR